MTSFVPAKSRSATIRATPDIWCQRDDQGQVTYQLFPSAALQLWDHHLHTSGLIPRFFSDDTSVIYEHDWTLTYQSITCFPQEGLMELMLEEDGSSAQTHLWVDRVGASTLYMSHLITLYDEVLATAVRVWTRRVPLERTLMPFSEDEREYFENECAPDQTILDYQVRLAERFPEEGENKLTNHCQDDSTTMNGDSEPTTDDNEATTGNTSDTLKSDDVSIGSTSATSPSPITPSLAKTSLRDTKMSTPTKRKMTMTLSSTLSLVSFGTFLPLLHGMFLLAVRVGPQHLDFVRGGDGKWASTTWLADLAFQALVAAELVEPPIHNVSSSTSVAIRYQSVAILGNELRCSLHGDRISVIRSGLPALGEKESAQIVVLVAKAEPL